MLKFSQQMVQRSLTFQVTNALLQTLLSKPPIYCKRDDKHCNSTQINLEVALGRLRLRNPILVASGTFGYAREMQGLVDFSKLGGILPKTITLNPRLGNAPWRTVETSSGLLNSIGLDNDGVETFIEQHLAYLRTVDSAIIVSIAGKSRDEFVELAKRIEAAGGAAALELNISCPRRFWRRRLRHRSIDVP